MLRKQPFRRDWRFR